MQSIFAMVQAIGQRMLYPTKGDAMTPYHKHNKYQDKVRQSKLSSFKESLTSSQFIIGIFNKEMDNLQLGLYIKVKHELYKLRMFRFQQIIWQLRIHVLVLFYKMGYKKDKISVTNDLMLKIQDAWGLGMAAASSSLNQVCS